MTTPTPAERVNEHLGNAEDALKTAEEIFALGEHRGRQPFAESPGDMYALMGKMVEISRLLADLSSGFSGELTRLSGLEDLRHDQRGEQGSDPAMTLLSAAARLDQVAGSYTSIKAELDKAWSEIGHVGRVMPAPEDDEAEAER